MAKKKFYDKEINKTTDWGGDSSTGDLPVVGGRVQEFVKETLSKKAGSFLFDEDKNSYLVFADAEDEALYVQSGGLMGELVLSEIKMADPGVDFRASSLTATNFATAETSNVFIKYTWSSLDKDEADTGNGTVVLSVANRTVFTGFVPQGENSIDISKYLITGDNNIRVSITDSYGNSRTMAYLVNLVALSVTSSYDPSTINEGEITFRYIPIGSVLKTAHFLINGVEVATRDITSSGSQITQTLPAQLHGSHSLVMYLSAIIGGNEVRSNELYYDIISVETGRTETLIASTFNSATIIEFVTLEIPYVVYNPLSNNSSVQLKVDGIVSQDVTVDRRLQFWNYKAVGVGNKTLEITSNGVTKTIDLVVTESEVNVKPELNDLKLFLTSQNRSNQQLNKAEWKYENIEAQLTGFDFATNGWVRDSQGSVALKVSNEARVVIPYKLFETEFRTSGKTIEFEFMATEVKKSNVSIISSIFGEIVEEVVDGEIQTIDRRVGFDITPQTVYFGSEQTSIDTNFKEDERVRIAFVVNKTSDDRLVQIYINGILSGVEQYPNIDNFTQIVPQDITIGSDDCSVMLYNIRVYDNNLTEYQLLNNYIGDMDDIDKKIEVFYRNQLYDAYGNISYERALQYVPCLIIEGKLPTFKGNKLPVNIYYENLQDDTKSYTATGAEIDVQGTSSQYYPRKNLKIKYKNSGFNMTKTGSYEPKYKLRDESIPETTFTYKADFTDSSGAHNTGLAVYYEWAWRELGFKTPVQDEGYANGVRTTVDGFPILIFHRETPDSYLEFVGKYNFNNDKTEATFGFEPGMQSWETLNNTSPRILFEKADFESLDVNGNPDWLNDYDDRYPDNGYDNPFKLKRLTEWVISCTDNPTKFADEVNDYFDVNSLLFYYVMSEFTAGIDQRGKNMFLTWYSEDEEDTDKCYLIFYDNDTVFGVNNEGVLQFGYGVEYHDKFGIGAGAANVWNAESSVLWDLVERALPNEIDTLYKRMRSENVISYERLRYYLDDIQTSKWSESIYNEDGKFKYINPLLEDGVGAYLYALQGSREEHRKWWLYNRVQYMDSKYTTATHLSDYATMRLYTPDDWVGVEPNPDFTLTAIGDTYARVKFGSYIIKKRIKGGTTEVIEAPGGMTFGDTETIVYGAKALTSIGDLSAKYVGTLDTSKATNLTELIVGSTATGYKNQNLIKLTVGNNNLLTKLNIANCSNLTQSVDLKGCPSIREIEATGSRISGIELPDGGSINYISLPGVASLTLKKQRNLNNETLKLDRYTNLTTLIIEDTPNIDPFKIINKATELNRVRLIGLDGSSNDSSVFSKIEILNGVDIDGNTIPNSYIEGKWHLNTISRKDFNRYKELWLDFNLTADELIAFTRMTMNTSNEFNGDLSLTPTEDFEVTVMYGDTEIKRNLIDGVMSVIIAPDMIFDNTPVFVQKGDRLSDIGNLANKYLGSLDISETPNYASLLIGSTNSGYNNPYFTELDLGINNNTLNNLNIANCSNYTDVLDLSECPNIKIIETIGSGINAINYPLNYNLTRLSLADGITSLVLKGQTELTTDNLVIGELNNLNKLVVEDCPLLDAIGVFDSASNLEYLRLVGIAGNPKQLPELSRAFNMKGVDADGELIPQSYLSGTWHFTNLIQEQYDLITETWSDLAITVDYITSDLTMYVNTPAEYAVVTPNANLTLTSNQNYNENVYFGEKQVGGEMITNIPKLFTAPIMTYNNTLVKISGASLLKSLGNLSSHYLSSLDASKIDTIEEFIIGNDSVGYYNNNFTNLVFKDSTVLKTIDISNCVNFSQALDLTGCPNMKTVKAKGTLIPKLNLHPNAKLTTLHLPDSVLDLNLSNQSLLINLSVGNITSLSVDGDTGFNIINFINDKSSLEKIRLTGIDVSEQLSGWLDLANSNIQGMNADGTICPLGDAVYGEYFVYSIDEERYNILINTFPNLVITYNEFVEPPIYFADPEVGRVLKSKGLIANASYSTEGELGRITSLSSTFRDNKVITKFPELKYCTKVTSMSQTFYGCSNLVNAPIIPESVTDMSYTFYECTSLVNAPSIPESVTNMSNTFYECTSLVNAPIIPESVTNMSNTFQGCTRLVEVPIIPESVTNMTQTFDGCRNLVNAPTIPESVTNLSYTFLDCYKLNGIYIIKPLTPPTYSSSLENVVFIYVPDSSVATYKAASGWKAFADKIYPISTKPE